MAGFAVFVTIVMYAFLTLVAACVTSRCLYVYARKRIPPGAKGRPKTLAFTALAPFVGVLWLLAALVLHVEISNGIAHQDAGLSGDPFITLPNGYELGSRNTYDGYFKAPGFETDVPIAGPGYVRSLIDLQFANGYFTGTQFDFKTSSIRPFTFDTRTRTYQASDTSIPTTFGDAMTMAQRDPTSYWRLYTQYRRAWPGYVLLALIALGEGAIFILVRKMWKAALPSMARP